MVGVWVWIIGAGLGVGGRIWPERALPEDPR